MTPTIDIRCDLNAEDDEGQSWALLSNAVDPALVEVGALLVAGTPTFWAVARVTAVDDDGQVHLSQLAEDDPEALRLLAVA